MCELEDDLNEFAKEIALEYGYPVPTVVLTTRFKRMWGQCTPSKRLIKLNRHFCENNEFRVIIDLLKHEIAHLRVLNHGPDFVYECAKMGISEHMSFDNKNIVIERGRFRYMCPGCGEITDYFKRLKGVRSCSKCSGGHYNPDFELVDVTA